MSIFFWCIGAFVLNFLIGCGVGAAIDDEDQRWLKYMLRCPLGYHFAVSIWPMWLCFWWLDRRRSAP